MTEPLLVVLVGVGIALVVVLAVVLGRRAAARRRAGLEAVASQAGWSFRGETVTPDTLGLGVFPLLGEGRARQASNVLRIPREGSAVTVFDYQYTVGAGRHQTTVVQTVAHMAPAGLSLPPFVLSPERFVHKVGGLLGYHDIDFDSSPEFSKRYLLRSKEAETTVRDLFTPSVRLFFEQREPLTVEGFEGGLVVYRQGRRVAPEDLVTFVEDAQAIVRQFQS